MKLKLICLLSPLMASPIANGMPSQEVLEEFQKCTVCHSQYRGDDNGVDWNRIVANGTAIVERLATNPEPFNKMPPDRAPASAKITVAAKQAMVAAIKAEIEEDPDFPLSTLRVPDGFNISLYAKVPGARSMTLAPDGTVYVGTGGFSNVDRQGRVWEVKDIDKDGKADSVTAIIRNRDNPNGVAFKDGSLFKSPKRRE